MNTPRKIIVLGAGSDGLVIAEAMRQAVQAGQTIQLAGFLDDIHSVGDVIEGVKVYGRLDDWQNIPEDYRFISAIQKVRDMPRRAARIDKLGIPADRWGTLIHPSAVVAQNVSIGLGVYVAACATIQPGCSIGDFATIRAGAALGHDAVMERHTYVGPNATMCGHAILREGAHLGPNAVIQDGIEAGCFSVVGIGAAATKHVREYAVVMGNPARRIGKVRPAD